MQMDQRRPLNILTRTDDEWKKYKYDVWPKARAWRMRFMEDIQGWSVEKSSWGKKKRDGHWGHLAEICTEARSNSGIKGMGTYSTVPGLG